MNWILKHCFLAIILYSGCQPSVTSVSETRKPNIIYILADDLGYGELGIYGQKKIQTPNIDELGRSGMLFTQHYSGSPVCAPSRYMFLTGKHSGHAYIRGNDEWGERGDVWDFAAAVEDPNLEGQRPIPANTVTLGNILQRAGYKTALVGKWGLGGPLSDGIPTKRGFDFFYGYNCQRQAHQLYPKHLWRNEEKHWLNNEIIAPRRDNELADSADTLDLASYAKWQQKYYAPAMMQIEALNFIEDNKNNPFFLYYASPLPHLPLQVPQEYVDRYVKLLGDEEHYNGSKGYFPNRYPHAAYAGMITYLDDQVGELIAKLKELDLYENTLIIFTSDNGPTYTGGVDAPFFNSAGPFMEEYGRTKGFTYEGGIRVPMIAHWQGKIEQGTTTDHISAFWDVLPTIADLIGAETPGDIDGISFLPTLLQEQVQTKHDFLYWEFPSYNGQQAVRMGKWKGIRKDIFDGNMEIELYNLENDPSESNNIAGENPDVVSQIENLMKEQHTPAENERFKMSQLGDVLTSKSM